VGVPHGARRPHQREIDRHLKRESTERLTIFHDHTRQQWKWPQTHNAAGAGTSRLVTHEHIVGRKNEALKQRLGMISFDIGDDPTVVEVNRRLRGRSTPTRSPRSSTSSSPKNTGNSATSSTASRSPTARTP
jgi:hypothetical protein